VAFFIWAEKGKPICPFDFSIYFKAYSGFEPHMALCFIQLKLKTTWARICFIFKIATYNLDKA